MKFFHIYQMQHSCWNTSYNHIIRNILCNNRTRSDYNVISNLNRTYHNDIGSKFHMMPNNRATLAFSIFTNRYILSQIHVGAAFRRKEINSTEMRYYEMLWEVPVP